MILFLQKELKMGEQNQDIMIFVNYLILLLE